MVLFLLVMVPVNSIFAADAVNVDVSSTSTTVGTEVEVTISLSGNKGNIEMVDLWVEYDATVLEAVSGYDQGGGGKVRILSTSGGSSYTIKFKGLTAGSCTVGVMRDQSIVSTPQADQNRAEIYMNPGTVTVKGAATQSKNNNLSALTVSPGTLTPAFSKDVTTYNMTLNEYCNRLTVSATPEDAKAKVSVWGAAMDPGDNTTKITVTAENGEAKVYTIYTKVPEAPKQEEKAIIIDIDGALFNVISNFDEELLPEGYEAADYTYKNKKIVVGKGLSNGKIIFCVSDAAVEKAEPQFVLYDEQTGTFSKLKLITTKGVSYTVVENIDVLNSVEIPEGFVESEYVLNNMSYRVWVDSNNPAAEYFIIYCTNVNGESGWYQYDMSEGTMQRAFLNGFSLKEDTKPEVTETEPETTGESVSNPKEMEELQLKYDNYVKKTKLALGLLVFLLVALVIIVVIFTIKSYHDSHDEYDDMEEEEEDEDEPEEEENTRRKKRTSKTDDDITFLE